MTVTADQLLECVLTALDDTKAKNVTRLDVRDLTSIADYMVIASGTSSRHVKSMADSVLEKCREIGIKPSGTEGTDTGEWVLVDLGDVVLHVMQQATREYYDLERLWQNPNHHPDRQ